MAHYVELPVYKASYDLLLYLFQLTGNLSREYKYTLGEKIKNETTDLLMHIYSANKKIEKLNDLGAARESLERIRLYIRLLK